MRPSKRATPSVPGALCAKVRRQMMLVALITVRRLSATVAQSSARKSSAPLAVASDAGTGRAPSLEALAPTVCHRLASTLATFGLVRQHSP